MIKLCENHRTNFNREAIIRPNGKIIELGYIPDYFKKESVYDGKCSKCEEEEKGTTKFNGYATKGSDESEPFFLCVTHLLKFGKEAYCYKNGVILREEQAGKLAYIESEISCNKCKEVK